MKKWIIGGAILALATAAYAVDYAVSKFSAAESMNVPVSAVSGWVTVRPAGTPDAADSTTTNPDTVIATDGIDDVFDMTDRGGTGIVVRFAYRGSVSTSPVIKVFGRYDSTEDWQVLVNRSDDDTATLTVDTTNDSTDGTDKFTTVLLDEHYFDCQGCRYIFICVSTAQSGGTSDVSYIQAKSF